MNNTLKPGVEENQYTPFSKEDIIADLEKYGLKDNRVLNFIVTRQGQGRSYSKALYVLSPNPRPDLHTSSRRSKAEIEEMIRKYRLPNEEVEGVIQLIFGGQTKEKTSTAASVPTILVKDLPGVNLNKDAVVKKTTEQVAGTIKGDVGPTNANLHLHAMSEELYANPRLVHCIQATYQGVNIVKMSSGGEALSLVGNGEARNNKFNISCGDIRHLRPEHPLTQFLGANLGNKIGSDVVTAISQDFPQGKGFAIIFSKEDIVGRNGFEACWTIVPYDDEQDIAYVKEHPEVLLEIYNTKFRSSLQQEKMKAIDYEPDERSWKYSKKNIAEKMSAVKRLDLNYANNGKYIDLDKK